ncbi:hypothetical protein [Thermoanaerobacter sp. RKWS2]|uniref:hypothetical protein n=1 Tax=Thermoanaerobacter sp. RKWS2 TaxID=2983842 RepID=UPI00175B9BAB|nr:hypothetical protein [Thermoanaerobacter sp. RKWS2]UZQ81888.1 hypothetical protein OEI98_001629 [Thermoanaerobacter sp. RKWS2]HHY79854.1 hypothetical protein [Thermoanaerobacter sp.]
MQSKKGNILMLTVIGLSIMIILSMIFISNIIRGQLHMLNIEKITQAYYTALTGIERTKPYWNKYITLNHAPGDIVEIKEAEGSAENNSYVKSVILKYLEVGSNYAVVSITSTATCGNNEKVVVRTLTANFSEGTLVSVNFLNEKNIARNYQQDSSNQQKPKEDKSKWKNKKQKPKALNVVETSSIAQ